jgi:hypothetical protein
MKKNLIGKDGKPTCLQMAPSGFANKHFLVIDRKNVWCSCGYVSGPFPTVEDAMNDHTDHLVELSREITDALRCRLLKIQMGYGKKTKIKKKGKK